VLFVQRSGTISISKHGSGLTNLKSKVEHGRALAGGL